MAVTSLESHCECPTDFYPLLMDRPESHNDCEHIIDIARTGDDASSSTSSHDVPFDQVDPPQHDGRPRSPVAEPPLSLLNASNSRNSSFLRRGDSRQRRSPLNSGLWISVELVLTLCQIIASIVVLALSKHEHPRTPLRAWIIGYASGCVAILPLLFWRYWHRNQGSEQDSAQNRQVSFQGNFTAGRTLSLPVTSTSEEDDRRTNVSATINSQTTARLNARLKALVEYFKMGLDCFFAVWFVIGNVWVFGGHSSSSAAPSLHSLCLVFLIFCCIGYAMPFILCATICCCLPCIISVLGFREDLMQTRGATPESINSLPTYKFKLKKTRSGSDRDSNSGAGEGGGVVAAGTDKERVISGEDAACCICLAKYANNDELRELSCSHFFHKDCVDKWLKINASCPLCKAEVGENVLGPLSGANASQGHSETQVDNGLASTVF